MRGKWVRAASLCGAVLLAGAGHAAGQSGAPPQASVGAELRALAAHAGPIFVGQIVSIERRGGVVEVTFRVEQSVAGSAGATYTMREWAGLWPQGMFRYTVGQRALAFLHEASGAGLSSPVHGSEGLVPVVVQGANAPQLLDVRHLAASVQRSPGTPLPSGGDGAILLSDALRLIGKGQSEVPEPVRLRLPGAVTPPTRLQPVVLQGAGPESAGAGAGPIMEAPVHAGGSLLVAR